MRDNRVRAVEAECGATARGDLTNERVGVEEFAVGAAALAREDGGEDDVVRAVECVCVFILKDGEARGGRARLEDGEEASARVTVTQGLKSLAHGGRVMRE